jgi:long-chain acyl-CoA synthetase
MFVCGGENIYPGEIEKLLERHAAVAQAIVVPAPDDIKGQIPIAFIVPRGGARRAPRTSSNTPYGKDPLLRTRGSSNS